MAIDARDAASRSLSGSCVKNESIIVIRMPPMLTVTRTSAEMSPNALRSVVQMPTACTVDVTSETRSRMDPASAENHARAIVKMLTSTNSAKNIKIKMTSEDQTMRRRCSDQICRSEKPAMRARMRSAQAKPNEMVQLKRFELCNATSNRNLFTGASKKASARPNAMRTQNGICQRLSGRPTTTRMRSSSRSAESIRPALQRIVPSAGRNAR